MKRPAHKELRPGHPTAFHSPKAFLIWHIISNSCCFQNTFLQQGVANLSYIIIIIIIIVIIITLCYIFTRCVPDASDTGLPSCKWGNLHAFSRLFTEARPLFVFISGNSESRPSSVEADKNKMAAPVKRFIFFVFVPRWSF